VKCGDSLPGSPGDYRIAKFPGTECALFKSNLSKAFKGQPWWPRCYNLPEERKELLKELGCQQSYWIAKPKNDYGGHGVRVWRADDPDLRKLVGDSQGKPVSVVQRYLSDPLLIGGYKFHMRIHMVVTSLDPPQAFVQRNGQCLFATQPYTLAQDSLGQSFRAPVHITNMTFNATVANKDNFFRPKPVIGKGQQFRMAHLERLLAKHHPCYSKEMLWGQVLHIAAEIVRYVARAASVRKDGQLQTDRHFELFGMDLMLDRNLNVFMCEVNTDPGLGYPDEIILGEPNPDYDKESGAAFDTWHDTLTLLGLDAKRGKHGQGSLSHWLQVEFPEAAV
jgi:tubulin polyglutamylase TTLL2